jgi:hypothetical protein
VDEHSHHLRRYSRDDLVRKVRTAGFDIEYAGSFNSILLPLMLTRLRFYLPFFKFDLYQSFTTGEWLNKLLYNLLRIELKLTRSGFSWPAGGSLMIAAKKNNIE